MKNKLISCCLSLMSIGLLVSVKADIVTTATRSSAPLAVTIAVPEQEGVRRLLLSNKAPHFFVTIRNTSSHPVSLYGEDSSWGNYNLVLEITAVGGKTLDKPLVVKRGWGVEHWFSNVAYTETLMPGDEVVRDVRVQGKPSPAIIFGDGTYRSFPLPEPTDQQIIRLRAVFTENEDKQMAGVHVWSGRAASEARDYEVMVSVP